MLPNKLLHTFNKSQLLHQMRIENNTVGGHFYKILLPIPLQKFKLIKKRVVNPCKVFVLVFPDK